MNNHLFDYILEDDVDITSINKLEPWKVLIVDDDDSVHQITRLVLNHFEFENRSLNILSAYSEEEAMEMLSTHLDIAIVLLDVVMNHDDSGLRIVQYIREDLSNKLIRIVLRTGQPGQAPEKKVIVNYDINDYKLKTELTADKLFVSIVSALRSYKDLLTLEKHSHTLQKTISVTSNIYSRRKIKDFVDNIARDFISIIEFDFQDNQSPLSVIIVQFVDNQYMTLRTLGAFEGKEGVAVTEYLDDEGVAIIKEAFELHGKLFIGNRFATCLTNDLDECVLFYIDMNRNFSEWDKSLIEIYSASVKAAYTNLYLGAEVEHTQREIIFTLGEVAEARSKETGYHVKRVSEYSKLLGKKIGLTEQEIELLGLASPVHDIGKLTISDNILNKPGPLTHEEFNMMKNHALAGYEMLKNSKRPLLKTAAIIALEHHEKWNGKGYPKGLSGEDIHIFGRIVALADVFDALGSERIYKKAWKIEDIITHIESESGQHFDPQLVELFLIHIDEFLKIKELFKEGAE